MEIEFLNETNKDEWNEFCLKSDMAWFRHTTYWMDYILCCRFDSNSVNHSFCVRHNKEIVAIVPLISQYIYAEHLNGGGHDEFKNYDTPTAYLAIKNNDDNIDRKNLIKFCVEEIEKIAQENNIKQAFFFLDPLQKNQIYDNFQNFNMMKFGYSEKLSTTTIIDLKNKTAEDVLRQMRKGHKADIKSVYKSKDFLVELFDSSNITEEKMKVFQEIHFADAGRRTRTNESWRCMYEQVLNEYAILLLVYSRSQNKYMTGSLFSTYKKRAYYGSYATLDSNYLESKVGYVVQWEAIKYFVENGFDCYETGWNYYGSDVDEKLKTISRFKHGFGGRDVPLLFYEKHYF